MSWDLPATIPFGSTASKKGRARSILELESVSSNDRCAKLSFICGESFCLRRMGAASILRLSKLSMDVAAALFQRFNSGSSIRVNRLDDGAEE